MKNYEKNVFKKRMLAGFLAGMMMLAGCGKAAEPENADGPKAEGNQGERSRLIRKQMKLSLSDGLRRGHLRQVWMLS